MKKGFESYVRAVVPYVPGEQPKKPNMIKLNTNECPYPPSKKVDKVLADFLCENLRLYPDPEVGKLVKSIAEYYEVEEGQVFVGVGSDDVLAMAFLTFFNSEKPILFPDISYAFYEVWADLFRIPFQKVPVNEQLEIEVADYHRENGGIIIPNPNAPTGIALDLESIKELLEQNQEVLVIIDEAYVDFGAKSARELLNQYDNLLVVQTFSKSRSMAGARIGYAFGSEKIIGYLNDAKFSFNSYTMNQMSIEAGVASLGDREYFENITETIVKTREWIRMELENLGFESTNSAANFLFVSHSQVKAETIYQKLREQDIYVRYFKKPRIDNYLRITVGTRREMELFLEAVKEIVKRSIDMEGG